MLVKIGQHFFSRLNLLFFGTRRERFVFFVNCIAVSCNILKGFTETDCLEMKGKAYITTGYSRTSYVQLK